MKCYYDLHLHSCLSPCAHEDMTPANLAGMCALAGLDLVALTDHNSAGNCAAFLKAAAAHGLLAIPGMELTTQEELHVLCWFETLEGAEEFGRYVHDRLPPMANDPRLFGPQTLMDHQDGVLGQEPVLLANAAAIGVDQVSALAARYGGVACPAHIERPSYSLYSSLGFWDPAFGFRLAECASPDFLARHPELRGVPCLTDSDAHYLDQIPDAAHFLDLPARSIPAVFDWLRDPR